MNDISVDEFIRKNYRPVDDKPGYVWLNTRRLEIISVVNLAASLERYFEKMQDRPIDKEEKDEWPEWLPKYEGELVTSKKEDY